MANGPIPKDEQVLHDCDNKICVNPAHLHLGTQTQNMHEARDRERFKSKVTADDVRAIRLAKISGATLAELAKIYGIGESAVSHICTRRNWSHID
jgi:hypothetical protein